MNMFTSVKSRIYLIAGLPLLVALFFILSTISEEYGTMHEMDKLEPTTQLGIAIGGLVHETQKERGATAGLLGSGDNRFKNVLAQQRQLTNEKRQDLTSYLQSFDHSGYDATFTQAINIALSELGKIDSIRSRVDSQSITAGEAIGYYTNHNALMLDIVQRTVEIATHAEISQLRSAYVNFMQGKERAGIERAVMSNVFAVDEFKNGSFIKFSSLVTIQDTYLKVFSSLASPEQMAFYEEQMRDPTVAEVQRMRDIASSKISNLSKAGLLAKLNKAFGYGGIIHQFKNYVLRGTDKQKSAFIQHFGLANKALDDYQSHSSVTAEDKKHLQTIRETLVNYRQALDKVSELHQSGSTAEYIDSIVKTSDDSTLKALYHLKKETGLGNFGVDSKHWFDTITAKINRLKAVEDKLAEDLGKRGNNLYSEAQTLLFTTIIITIAIIVGIIITVLVVSRGILNPLQQSVNFAEQIATGDLTGTLVVDRKDELGQLQQAMSTMRNKLVEMFSGISSAATELARAAEDMAVITKQTSIGIHAQQSETEQVATAMNEMAATVNEVANSANNAAEGAREADQAAQKGQQIVNETIAIVEQVASKVESNADVVRKVNEDSAKIGVVLEVIRGIAEQTNLLALNAAIEAARAGEHGRGFAVVADEVRTLASRTQESTQEINTVIEGLQMGADEAMSAMDEGATQARSGAEKAATAKDALLAIAATVASINDMNGQIASASEEQSSVAKEIDRSVVNISQVANETSIGADKLSSASGDLSVLSIKLKDLVSEFKV